MRKAIRAIWNEPAAPDPSPPGRRDWALTGVLVTASLVEAGLRSVAWKPTQLFFVLAVAIILPWRRTHPLAVAGFAFVSFGILSVAMAMAGADPDEGIYTGIFMIMLPYTLFRWGSGRSALGGLPMVVLLPWTSLLAESGDLGSAIAGTVFFLFPAELGVATRYWHKSRERAVGDARLHERELLARELHDTVAHHVSAIAIQAQAGKTLAATDQQAALRTLDVIDEEASRTLAEMRTMVGVLRKGESADMRPQPGVADISGLADTVAATPKVEVQLSGSLDHLQPLVDAATYRIAQESVTNARRHARGATRVQVCIVGDDDSIRLAVRDDGTAAIPDADSPTGYGLAGMAERAKLLGGTFAAGPHPERGWVVEAVLPKHRDSS